MKIDVRGELQKLFDGEITPENMPWYVQAELLPKFDRLSKAGLLTDHKRTKVIKIAYQTCTYTVLIMNGLLIR